MPELERTAVRFTPGPCTCDIAVYFSTGFRYAEGPTYIGTFGGHEDSMFDVVSWVWERGERQHVCGEPDVQFPATLEGTEALYDHLKKQGYPTRTVFGLLIWHQLGYTSRLEGNYEGGQCGSMACWHRIHMSQN